MIGISDSKKRVCRTGTPQNRQIWGNPMWLKLSSMCIVLAIIVLLYSLEHSPVASSGLPGGSLPLSILTAVDATHMKEKPAATHLAGEEGLKGDRLDDAEAETNMVNEDAVKEQHPKPKARGMWETLQQAKKRLNESHQNPLEEKLKRAAIPAIPIQSDAIRIRSAMGLPLLVVFTKTDCSKSEEALREAQIAQPMIYSLGGSTKVAHVATEKEPQLVEQLGVGTVPLLRLYKNGNTESMDYTSYNGTDMTATEIAHWVLGREGLTVQYPTANLQTMGEITSEGSPVGPVVRACVHRGGRHDELLQRIANDKDNLPSPFIIFKIYYVDLSDKEEFRVYRQQLPFNVGETELLSLTDPVWEEGQIRSLLLKAEDREIFYGESPTQSVLGERVLFSVYVSKLENLQDIAELLMEFQPTYKDRIAFHIAKRTVKSAARSSEIFSHKWGGAVLTSQKDNEAAYQRTAGVFREEVPFERYALSMPFNYHNLKNFFEEWESGKRQLHFRSNRYSYTKKHSPVVELNHVQFVTLLHKQDREPLAILYYEKNCTGCREYHKLWTKVAMAFASNKSLKGQMLFGQVDGQTNDLIDFDMRKRLPAIAVYPPGPKALDRRIVYTGPLTAENLGNFLAMLRVKRDEL